MTRTLGRRTLLTAAALPFAARAAGAPIVVGISGPLTGQYAQYGADWARGFDLALREVNGAGGIAGRMVETEFQDTQADPRQAVAVAQRFVGDPRIVAELGDFSSAASMAASPIYQRGRLVQFGFTNSHPDFTKGGDYMWSNAPNQADDVPTLADFAITRLGFRKLGILYINGDWGRTSKDLMLKAAAERGATVVASEGYLPNEQDFRSSLVRVRETAPDAVLLFAYYPDGAQLVRQARDIGLKQPVVAAGSIYSPKFLELGGPAVEGVHTQANFFPEDPRPVVQHFVQGFRAMHGMEPGSYNARAYDAMVVLTTVMRQFGTDRAAIHDGLAKVRDIPSVLFGTATFDPATRRVSHPASVDLIVKDGRFTVWKPAT